MQGRREQFGLYRTAFRQQADSVWCQHVKHSVKCTVNTRESARRHQAALNFDCLGARRQDGGLGTCEAGGLGKKCRFPSIGFDQVEMPVKRN